MKAIFLTAVGKVDPDVMEYLYYSLGDGLSAECEMLETGIDISESYNSVRGQYYSTELLAKLAEIPIPEESKILGICSVDLFIPILTFVFGEAQLGGRAALVSTFRLRQQFYGLPEDQRQFLERAEKEALHELGHTFGLVHCQEFECLMSFSNSVDGVDLKTNNFCSGCRSLAGL